MSWKLYVLYYASNRITNAGECMQQQQQQQQQHGDDEWVF